MKSIRPLDNFPAIRTNDIEEASEGLARIYVRPSLALPPPDGSFNATINECRLHNVRLVYATFGAPFGLEFPAADYFLQILPVRGKGEVLAHRGLLPLSIGVGATISPDAGYRAQYAADYEAVLLKVDKKALTQKLVAITGATVNRPLCVEPVFDTTRPAAKMLQQYLPALADMLSTAEASLPPWWKVQTEQLLMTMFLCAHRHNYSHLMDDDPPEAAPWQVRRVEEYIETNWHGPITLEDLADVAGVSAFSLFRSFKKVRGYSPLEFAARVRTKNEANW
jgi:hypothetical protein